MKPFRLPFVIWLLVPAVACSGGCARLKRAGGDNSLARCVGELNAIPEMAALLKSRSRDNGEARGQSDERPFEGMQVALVMSGMIRGHADPDEDLDDWCYTENSPENFDKLVAAIKQNGLPPTVDFISARGMDAALVEQWLRSGNLIGTTSYSRMKARNKSADARAFIDDVARNEALLAPLWEKYPHRARYFRYPRQKTSRDAQKREQIAAYLKERGYTEVIATIDARDSSFAETYCAALAKGEQPCASLVKEHFKTLLLDTTVKAREAGRRAAGYDIKHVLIVGANQLTCDYLSEVLAWYKRLGARFISLADALADPFYSKVDQKGRPVARSITRETTRMQLEAAGRK
jgi:peptidoglycan/xylan/chitin deacetylase (PgdA/CDA1 family)